MAAESHAVSTTYCGGACSEGCVEITPLGENAFAVRDHKLKGSSPELRMTGNELDAFAVRWVRERGLIV
ncbi:MAG TPA: DUF397 domain-containing protein [Pseudonocardiaceae bacterium]|nr:DUF397 domain-containing protein [Pseudonocardiaceae bacterium]